MLFWSVQPKLVTVTVLFNFVLFSDGQVATLVKPQITRHEIREQLKQEIAEFYARFRQKYLALRRKHIKELKELRKLSNNNGSAGKQFR